MARKQRSHAHKFDLRMSISQGAQPEVYSGGGVHDVCVVAYALNPKKLRRGHAPGAVNTVGSTERVPIEMSLGVIKELEGRSKGYMEGGCKIPVLKLEDDSSATASSPSSPSSREVSAHKAAASAKWTGGGLADLLEGKHFPHVRFEAFDYDAIRSGVDKHYDVIIHKLTEDMESKDSDSANKIDSIKDYLYRHPSASIIDPFEAVRAVVSRARTCRRLRELEDDFERRHGGRRRCPFRQPRFAVSESPELLGEAVQRAGLSFPVICKPIEACGTPLSHSMVVAVDAEGLSLVESPSIAQEYINHSGLFFKVYVIDHDVMVFQRPSLPDILAESCGEAASSSVRSVVFDSRFAYPTVEDFYFSGGGALCSDGEQSASSETSGSVALDTRRRQHRRRKPRNEDLAAHSAHKHHNASAGNKHSKKQAKDDSGGSLESRLDAQFVAIAKIISEGFGLSLYGFDVIIPSSSDRQSHHKSAATADQSTPISEDELLLDLVVVDINFFPSYKEVHDFPDKLCHYLVRKKLAHQKSL